MNKKRTIIIASMVGVIALSSVSLTLAWYANSNVLTIRSIEVQITGDRQLLISTSGEEGTFKEELTYDDLEHVHSFIPASTMYSDAWKDEKSARPIFYDASHDLVATDGVPFLKEANTGYYSQELYLL